jgi:hypothetical protein
MADITYPAAGGSTKKLKDQGGYHAEVIATDSAYPLSVADAPQTPKGYYQASVSTVVDLATAIGASIPSGARGVWITPESAGIRFRDDGTDPTASVGQPVAPDQSWPYIGTLSALKLVAKAGTVTVNFLFFN